MINALVTVIDVLIPVFVAVITVVGGVLVAKIDKVQKNIVTNHGSKSLGDAVDIIRTKVDVMGSNQQDLITTVKHLHSRDEQLGAKVDALDAKINLVGNAAQIAFGASVKAERAATGTVRVVEDKEN